MTLGSCKYQNSGCGCQVYLEDINNPERCFYCNHFNAFHVGFTTETSNYGMCQKDFAYYGCQSFVASFNDKLICKYCNHFNAFHKPKSSNIIKSITH